MEVIETGVGAAIAKTLASEAVPASNPQALARIITVREFERKATVLYSFAIGQQR